jgi:hypothetical protein
MLDRPEHLLIDIESILKMVRFEPSFFDLFSTNLYLSSEDKIELAKYKENANILSKEHMWSFCCVVEHIIEINKIIQKWRSTTTNYAKIELDISNIPEKEYSYDIIGRMIKTKNKNIKFKKMMRELKDNNYHFNGLSTIISRAINKGEINRIFFFY